MTLPSVVFTSCRGRELELGATLAAFHAAWPPAGPPALVVVDSSARTPHPALAVAQIAANFGRALRCAVDSGGGGPVLFLEDDIRFAPAFADRLAEAVERQRAEPFALRLYRGPGGIGRQGVVLSSGLVDYIERRWHGLDAAEEPRSDRRLFQLIAGAGAPCDVVPLVQHVGRVSTVEGATFHRDDATEDLRDLDA